MKAFDVRLICENPGRSADFAIYGATGKHICNVSLLNLGIFEVRIGTCFLPGDSFVEADTYEYGTENSDIVIDWIYFVVAKYERLQKALAWSLTAHEDRLESEASDLVGEQLRAGQ